ncbi:AraC family transcriptional regulator [Shimia abyssi]|uniref:AraC family transcriptional regulator n=1 Tax=Shimia abyssi TaxID=1662395 RepID=A0A2P8F6X3_9RHOB|nr:AraC family transcriptional regulator [Shimia abyssi]PSL17452.1 AraC family transcriptional regulator [Shimia abyssi]
MQSYEDRLTRVLRYIHDNPAGDMSLDTLADVAALSRFHWHRVFLAMTGETCAQLVRRVRMHKAAAMLHDPTVSVSDVATAVGYESLNSFSRAFRAQYDLSPKAFREQGGRPATLLVRSIGETDMQTVTIRQEPARHLVGVAHQGAYTEIGGSFGAFSAVVQSRNLWPQIGAMIGVFDHDPNVTPEADLRSFAGGEWKGDSCPDGLVERQLNGGRTAVLTFKGPYVDLHKAYDAMFGTWLPQSGELPDETPCFEVYLNDPMDVAPAELLTEICLPLQPRSDKMTG